MQTEIAVTDMAPRQICCLSQSLYGAILVANPWSIYGLRTLILVLNFIFPVGINFNAITSIRHFSWAGEMVSVPIGVPNPFGILSQVSLLLLLVFSVDAAITVWRRGDHRRALLIGGSMR